MRNFTIDDFTGSGQYLVRMTPQELYAIKGGQVWGGCFYAGTRTINRERGQAPLSFF